MHIDIPQRLMLALAMMTPGEQRAWLSKCGPEDALLIDAAFEAWHAKGQLEPTDAGWRVWLMMAGRGFGKTRAGAEWIHRLAMIRPVRIALVGASIAEARLVMVEGVSGILSVARRQRLRLKWEPSVGRLTWPRGSVAQLFSGDHADGLRGPEHHFAWCDELAKWREAEAAWDNLQMGLRAGPRPRALVTTTPRPLRLLERIGDDTRTVTSGGRTKVNINLPPSFVDAMIETYGGTRIGAQELDGVLMGQAEGSLWPKALIERSRGAVPGGGCERILVGVDPPAGGGEESDACGIVVCGRAGERMYVLADDSVAGLSPEGWANRVAAAAARWDTSQVIAEANNGGAMVKSVLMAADLGLTVRLVHASKGKVARAEPIALRFETGRALFAGIFPKLEAELGGLIAGGGYEGPGRSPDRADAMVWAMTVLGETRSGVPRVTRL
jgi:phage terminase large subunit-like protein